MDKNPKRLALKKKVARLLALLSFFHLSGLNNGFTQVAFVTGQMDSYNFAPIVIEKTIQVLNPKFWKQTISSAPKVIEFSSQRAVTRLLVESNLMQLWLKNVLSSKFAGKVCFVSPDANRTNRHSPIQSGNLANNSSILDSGFRRNDGQGSRYIDALKQQYWDKLTYVNQKGGWKLWEISKFREGNIALSQSWEGVENLKFKGVGYHRTRAGGDGVNLFNGVKENTLKTLQSVSFFGESL